jgi:hypothetical protein
MSAEDALHGALQVVIAQGAEDAAEVCECPLMGFREGLLCGVRLSPVIGRAAGHRPHLEDLQLYSITTQQSKGFISIDLRFRAPLAGLCHENFPMFQTRLLPSPLYITAY